MAKTLVSSPGLKTDIAKACTNVSVGGTSTTLVQANKSRCEITIVNDHATQIVYLELNTTDGTTVPTATLNNGIRLNAAGGSWTSDAYLGPVAAIATGASTVTLVTEI